MACICNPNGPFERNGHTATCNRLARKIDTGLLKPPKKKAVISKVGKNNLSECSSGQKVTDEQIRQRRAQAYSKLSQQLLLKYPDGNIPCEGCGNIANGHAHIIPQARCKVLRLTELIWDLQNFFPSCNECNTSLENPKGEGWKKLNNLERCMKFIEQNDPQLFVKFSLNRISKYKELTEFEKSEYEQNILT
jgi:hypothetical protein